MLWQPKHKVMSKSMCTGTWLNLAVLICQHRETATAVGYWAGLCVVSYPGLIEQICARTWLYSFTEAHQNALLNCSYNQQKSKASNGIITSDKSSQDQAYLEKLVSFSVTTEGGANIVVTYTSQLNTVAALQHFYWKENNVHGSSCSARGENWLVLFSSTSLGIQSNSIEERNVTLCFLQLLKKWQYVCREMCT